MLVHCHYCNSTFQPIPPQLDEYIWHPSLRYCPCCFQFYNRLVTYLPITGTSTDIDLAEIGSHYSDSDYEVISSDEEHSSSDETGDPEVVLRPSQQFCFIQPSGDCGICLDNFENEQLYRQLPCQHKFHDSCISSWFEEKNTCPLCRKKCAILQSSN